MIATSVTRGRENWTADFVVRDGRAVGDLRRGNTMMKKGFSIKIVCGVFTVGYRSESGVETKVTFRARGDEQ
jgi:hypothetical protein